VTDAALPATTPDGAPDVAAELAAALAAPVDYTCPRCRTAVVEPYYGPCSACRTVLKAAATRTTGVAGAGAAPARFEPKMNVVPNQVATKD
jgi:predicted anti-sigma-YlaC factor YlaD